MALPKVEVVPISALTPDDKNANKGNARGREMLDASLADYRAGRSTLADKNLRLIAGNKTHEAAQDAGIEEVILIHTDGSQLVAVVRDDLDLDTPAGRALAIADNRIAEVNLEWDIVRLKALADEMVPVGKYFTDDTLASLQALADNANATSAPVPEPDAKVEPTLASDVLIEIRCGKEQLAFMQATLEQWGEVNGVTVDISA